MKKKITKQSKIYLQNINEFVKMLDYDYLPSKSKKALLELMKEYLKSILDETNSWLIELEWFN